LEIKSIKESADDEIKQNDNEGKKIREIK